ncbi:hypothetical protein [Psittacicella gerlachiana]|uniref:Uncharacterized protein n=1 Tax=Psittacicella gerlachiana TaxID=2028574 RepID=A0A3A1YDP5_9GAMM|nr:hypothetical protein [Psittacicella gerlachiana]RIY35369.1 hypothetical protein CKF59_03705 [Psittacicella gerlachiana]
MSEIEYKSKRRKRRKNNLPDPITLAENYLDVLIAKLAIRKKDRLEILTNKFVTSAEYENGFIAKKIDDLVFQTFDQCYEPETVIVKSDGAVRSIYSERIKQLKVFTYDINTKINYLTHDPSTPLRRFYEREHVKNVEREVGFTNSVVNK